MRKVNESERITKWLTDAAAIAALSASGYATAFAYEAGFCAYFRLPRELIRLDIVGVLAATSIVGASVFLGLWMAQQFAELLRSEEHPIRRTVFVTGIMASLSIPLLIVAPWDGPQMGLIAGPCSGVVLREWFAPLKHRAIAGYVNKMRAYQAATTTRASPGTMVVLGWPLSPVFVVVALAWWLGASYLVGGHDARSATDFLVKPGSMSVAVLRFYGDNVVAAAFDPKTRVLTNEFHIIPLTVEGGFQRRHLGRLRPGTLTR